MNASTIAQHTHNDPRRAAVMCAPVREAAWRLRLSGSCASLASMLPDDAFVGTGLVRLDRVPELPDDEIVITTTSVEILGPYVPASC